MTIHVDQKTYIQLRILYSLRDRRAGYWDYGVMPGDRRRRVMLTGFTAMDFAEEYRSRVGEISVKQVKRWLKRYCDEGVLLLSVQAWRGRGNEHIYKLQLNHSYFYSGLRDVEPY